MHLAKFIEFTMDFIHSSFFTNLNKENTLQKYLASESSSIIISIFVIHKYFSLFIIYIKYNYFQMRLSVKRQFSSRWHRFDYPQCLWNGSSRIFLDRRWISRTWRSWRRDALPTSRSCTCCGYGGSRTRTSCMASYKVWIGNLLTNVIYNHLHPLQKDTLCVFPPWISGCLKRFKIMIRL